MCSSDLEMAEFRRIFVFFGRNPKPWMQQPLRRHSSPSSLHHLSHGPATTSCLSNHLQEDATLPSMTVPFNSHTISHTARTKQQQHEPPPAERLCLLEPAATAAQAAHRRLASAARAVATLKTHRQRPTGPDRARLGPWPPPGATRRAVLASSAPPHAPPSALPPPLRRGAPRRPAQRGRLVQPAKAPTPRAWSRHPSALFSPPVLDGWAPPPPPAPAAAGDARDRGLFLVRAGSPPEPPLGILDCLIVVRRALGA